MFSHSLGIDDEVKLFQADDTWTWFRQGRFLIGAVEFIVDQPITPLFPYLLLAVSYVASHCILLASHGLTHSWRSHLAYLIFILFPTNWLTQEFVINVPGFAVGLLATSLAAFLTLQAARSALSSRGTLLLYPLIVALLVAAIGGFQSLITLYLAIGVGVFLFHRPAVDSFSGRQLLAGAGTRMPLLFLGLASTAVVLHTGLFKLLLALTRSEVHQIDRYFRSPYFMLRTQPIPYLLGNLEQLVRTYLTPGWFYSHSLWAFSALLIGSGILYGLWPSFRRRSPDLGDAAPVRLHGWMALAGGALLLVIPLALNGVSAPFRIPMRALMALPYVGWLAAIVWLEMATLLQARWLRWMGAMLAGVLITQCLVATSSYYAARQFNYRADQLVASTLTSAIVQARTDPSNTVRYLASSGALPRRVPYRVAWYSTAGSSFFNWDGGNEGRMVNWLKAMGIDGLQPADPVVHDRVRGRWDSMPTWPQPGSIRVEGDTVLIHFGPPSPS